MKIITYTAFAVLGAISTSTAFAGCGRASHSSVNFVPGTDRALARQIFGAASESPAAVTGKPSDPTGLWFTVVTFESAPVYQAFEAFTSDGLEILNDNSPTLEGNVCLGTWTATGRNTAKVFHPSWSYDESGNLNGSVVIREQITISADGNSFTGSVTVEAFDLSGDSQGIVFAGDLSGKRMNG